VGAKGVRDCFPTCVSPQDLGVAVQKSKCGAGKKPAPHQIVMLR
jgi:hypothetical protein